MKQNRLDLKTGTGLLLCLLTILLFSSAVGGQSVTQITINYIEALPAPDQFGNKVRAYVTISSADQETVQGLTVSDFKALEDGKEIAVKEVSQTDEPMSVVLAIDTSGSMRAQDRSGKTSMEAAKEAAVEFISMLKDNDQVALFSFDNETNFHLDFSVDHEASIRAVKSLSAKYKAATRLYDTALEAVKKASEIPKGRRAIILLTDGKDEKGEGTRSIHSSNDVIDAATTKTIRVPIYTMGVGPQVDAKELGRIASLTGGRSMLASSLSELPGFYRTIANQLKNQYVIEYVTGSPSGEHSLIIKAAHDGSIEQDEKRFWSPPLPVMRPPEVNIMSPGPTDPIRGIISIRANITPEKGISKVRYYVDAVLKNEDTTSPYGDFEWDTTGLAAGLHVIRVEAVHINGQAGSSEITVKVTAPTAVPSPAPPPGKTEDKGGIPYIVWIIIIVLLIIIAAAFFWRRRQTSEKDVHPPSVTTVSRVAKPVERVKRAEDEPEPSDSADNEATTMDVKAIIDPLAKLTVLKSQELDLGATLKVLGTTAIGRGTDNDIRIPDKSVSRKHAIIYYSGGNFFLRDLNSSYGTKMDGQEVTSAGLRLKDGAQIQLGNKTVLEFNILVFGKDSEDDDKTMIYGQD
ncbi:MAG: FHA domain-containing protein [Deltaproteobacteria bacterium]|nr:FHA domain-containing protein [Deltaproteobacteria bacterium]